MNALYHKKHGIVQLLILVTAILSLSVILAAAASEVGDVIYSEGFEAANTMQQNGDAVVTLTDDYASAGTKSLSVAPTAENNYSGVAIRNDSLDTPMMPGGKYKLTAKVFSAKDATLGVRVETKDGSGGNTYGSVGSASVTLTAGQWVDTVMDFAIPADHQSVSSIVFHNNDKVPELVFCLDEINLQITAVPAPVEEPVLTDLLTFSFNDKAAQESLFTAASSSGIEWISEAGAGKGDNTALKVNHIQGEPYTSMNNAVRLTFSEPLPAGGTYNISVWFYAPAAGNEGKDTLTGPGVVINGEYAQSLFKLPSNFGTLPVGEWKQVNVKTPLMETPLRTIDFRLVVNDEANHPDIWRIDDIVISQIGAVEEIIVPEWDLSISSLSDTYKDSFLIGNVMNSNQTADADMTAMYKHHYNAVTAENDMKPQNLSSAKGVYNFTNADTLVTWAEANHIKIHGHTLVWHSQSAAWLTNDSQGKALTRAEAKANMEEYIKSVAGHFKGKLISWDVVNEAFDGGSGVPEDWKTVLRTASPWYIAYENGADISKGESGADYIYDAFVFARLADPKATLYYNDYNETEAWKREAMALMTEELNEKWKTDARNTESDRLLVEGIGMQAHYWTDNLKADDVAASIARFVEAGAQVSITELDIPYGSYGNIHSPELTKDQQILQGRLYAQLFEIFKKYSGNIERVTFWGKTDPQSWRNQGSPLLFDKAFAAKQSYYSVIDPKAFMIANWINPYSDVKPADWFYPDVAYVSAINLAKGTGLTTYSPEGRVTWSQFLTILYRMDGQTGVSSGANWNVAADEWAIKNGLAQAGFTSSQLLNRQDMAVMIEKYLNYSGNTLPVNVTPHTYADDAAISLQAKSAVALLYNANIITGKPGNLFDPAGYTNRGEIAAILHRLTEAMETADP